MDIKLSAFSAHNFECEYCHIVCSRKNDWNRHLLTRKHIVNADGNSLETKNPQKSVTCKCGRKYATKSGLWKHDKTCKNDTNYNTMQAILSDNNNNNNKWI